MGRNHGTRQWFLHRQARSGVLRNSPQQGLRRRLSHPHRQPGAHPGSQPSPLSPMAICYAITSNEYSDFRVSAIFTTREKAKAELFKYGLKAKIEELPLDPITPAEWPNGSSLFCCFGNLSTGLVNACMKNMSEFRNNLTEKLFEPQRASQHFLCVFVIAKDRKHAVKIAAEKFKKSGYRLTPPWITAAAEPVEKPAHNTAQYSGQRP
jgi:hypothetical protein